MIIEIVILAMIAAFLGLRLYSVLGRRAEHGEEVVPRRMEARDAEKAPARDHVAAPAASAPAAGAVDTAPQAEAGIRAIAAADGQFDLLRFLEGAKGAYAMVLEAFWKGDRDALRDLCADDVYAGFVNAIDEREAAGESLDNRLIRIEDATVQDARLEGRMAHVTVLFVADVAAVTRDRDGNVVAGSLNDAVESRDLWTFTRDVSSDDPAWLLSETDQD
ncbi:Tim44 domain-containing protein [Erythrobacteraceae bacterium CFH 75059]|uniref:Tim44/TimA family putative adaptor protein n=1 Tax=Qipengyuania thermophila TaxID=2509361 RepID=UPI00102260E5|nr:Tim44/TimA family putative adaptor protein [Qipengyuania thermophila]TCD01907.1 Tim44 domain-containing protein [Erythrobacteraceae bacterium CFH 75059]